MSFFSDFWEEFFITMLLLALTYLIFYEYFWYVLGLSIIVFVLYLKFQRKWK